MKATWSDDSDSSSSDDEEHVANMCFMAIESDNNALKGKVDKLNTTLAKLTQGSKILDTMLAKTSAYGFCAKTTSTYIGAKVKASSRTRWMHSYSWKLATKMET
ncbi:hypothetical protein NC651_026838 [Populus alba x Populus x berolinensis]|nr:hypothetical protein NC651_026838 [Populus alba x Populus x berolinensis]